MAEATFLVETFSTKFSTWSTEVFTYLGTRRAHRKRNESVAEDPLRSTGRNSPAL